MEATAPPVRMRQVWRELNLDASQRQTLQSLLPEHRRRVQEARQRLAQKRLELFDLIKAENPDWGAIQAKVKEISALQGGLEEEIARFLLEFKQHLRPEQQTVFVNLVQTRLAMGPMGCGPGGRWGRSRGLGNGRGPGQGTGPAGVACPPQSK